VTVENAGAGKRTAALIAIPGSLNTSPLSRIGPQDPHEQPDARNIYGGEDQFGRPKLCAQKGKRDHY
jgi:hypothetical protein